MPDFPQNPYPITGFLQGAGAGVTVTGINLTSGGTEQVSTESDGSFIIDPANMENGYNNGDIIHIKSGIRYNNIKIDLDNYPDGIEKNLVGRVNRIRLGKTSSSRKARKK